VNTIAPAGIKALYSSEPSRSRYYNDQYAGRKRTGWNSSVFTSGPDIDDGELHLHEEDVYDFKIDFVDTSDARHHTDMKVSLVDIARPAKRKGAAKDFEVVQTVRNVIALEDEFEGLGSEWEDDEWEQIFDESRAEEQKSYSSVLRGNET